MPRYEVTTFDVCTQGFERLRSNSEFILVAYPNGRSGAGTLRKQWLDDLQSCERPEGFDYGAAKLAIGRYCAKLQRHWKGKRNPMDAAGRNNGEDGSELCAFLYVKDTKSEA